MTGKFLSVLIFFYFFTSCSPLYMVYVQNNTDEPVEIFVELKDEKFTKKYRKELEKRHVFFYKKSDQIEQFSIDSLKILNNKISEKKYQFTSDLEYSFVLEPDLITNIDPNNSISIYPFQKIYFVKDNEKCSVVPKNTNHNCNFKITSKQKLKKDKTPKMFVDYIEIQK